MTRKPVAELDGRKDGAVCGGGTLGALVEPCLLEIGLK